jgi:hypothetical protein
METWCEHWNIKINEDKTQGNYSYRSRRPPQPHRTLNERNISFVNGVKYLGVIFHKKVTYGNRTYVVEMIKARAFRTQIRVYFTFKSEQLSANIKFFFKALIRSTITYAFPAL